ncbi:Ubiquitinconjugating enzyme subfamily protein [Acanthamoeba castellanii str. Neff]|uniref:Ubiquitinconjugating enzyme subfamily protein n=1 Tax=Acanthamoeba castellanii (strain ATCC 30010 / Neff) TaxID=1257118 RepID=L8GSV2_ACACF|nr:Ubiquitinconjugating enzyme subfamily protein [Acanthamoeba castellanii str. Neff]ELR15668.1 Ubiquitinconjugating enzyme subfamily protein [Acanthamoeba castellanii str. Neff]
MVPSSPPTSEKVGALERISWELDQFDNDPPHGIYMAPYRVQVTIQGPHGSPYEGGIFKLDWSYSPHHPTRPPIVRFLTRIYHPSVDDEGKLGLRVLGPGLWRKEFTIRQILLDIKLLLLDPGTGGYPLVPGVRDIFNTDLDQFNRLARGWTRQYAGRDQACRPAGEEGEEEGYSRKKRPNNFAGPPLPPPSSLLHQPPAKRRRPDTPETLTLPLPPPLHPITLRLLLLPAPFPPCDRPPSPHHRQTPLLRHSRHSTPYGRPLNRRLRAQSLTVESGRAVFAREEVSYAAFLLLDADDLAQMGLPIGPRKVLLARIHQLRNNDQQHHESEHVV